MNQGQNSFQKRDFFTCVFAVTGNVPPGQLFATPVNLLPKMKKMLFVFFCCLFWHSVSAQPGQKPSVVGSTTRLWWRMVYADTANNMFFARYPHIKEIQANLSADPVTQFYLTFDTAGAGGVYGEFYDLLFEGDAYMYK